MLSSKYDIKDLCATKKIVEMEIKKFETIERYIFLKANTLRKFLEKFNMVNAKSVSTLLVPHFNLSTSQSPSTEGEGEVMKNIMYASIVGKLTDAMLCTRSDLAQDLRVKYKYTSNLGNDHWKVAKCILRYL